MSAAEAAFFDGDHCQHVAARDEQRRLARRQHADRQVLRLRLSSPNRTTTPQADAGHLPLFIASNEWKLL